MISSMASRNSLVASATFKSFGTLLDKLICRLNLERVLGRLSNQYFKERPIYNTKERPIYNTPNINLHLKNIYNEGELDELSTIKDSLIVQKEGGRQVKRTGKFYNLDAIVSVGYRIKSHVATRFRQWATQRLREYIIKGFILDDERLKNPDQPFDYFDELLRLIQDIRTSERRFYQKITDAYATSIDYDPTTDISINFFKTVQNKLH